MPATIDRTLVYRSVDGDRIEHAHVRISDAGGVADGTIVGVLNDEPLRVRHELTCDSRWHVRNANVEVVAFERRLLSMSADEDGIWRRVDGGTLDVPLYHCFDVAIAGTAMPALLSIRRMALELREAAIVSVAQIAIPSLDVRLIEHRYTYLAVEDRTHVYRFENFDSGERTLVRIDPDGLVTAFDGMLTRVWPIG